MIRKTIAVFAVLLTAVSVFVSPAIQGAEAARCARASFQAEFSKATSVFVGKVTGDATDGDKRIIEFAVEKYWKGPRSKRLTVTVYETVRFQSPFEPGKRYLVYAGDEDGDLIVSRCSRSRPVENAADDLKKLGNGKTPRR